MNDYVARFTASPASFKKSFAMLVVAWVCHLIFVYLFFLSNRAVAQAEDIIWRMAIVGGCLCLLLFLIKKWARALVVMGNCLILVYDIFIIAVSPPNKTLTLLCVGVVLLAILGTYWLFVKETRDYFNQVNPKIEPTQVPDPNAEPDRVGKNNRL
jgi:hypothetical protein